MDCGEQRSQCGSAQLSRNAASSSLVLCCSPDPGLSSRSPRARLSQGPSTSAEACQLTSAADPSRPAPLSPCTHTHQLSLTTTAQPPVTAPPPPSDESPSFLSPSFELESVFSRWSLQLSVIVQQTSFLLSQGFQLVQGVCFRW